MSEPIHDVGVSDQPFDRLTELAAEMTKVLDAPEHADVRAIVFLNDAHSGGIQLFGYDDQVEAMAELFIHMKAIMNSMGKDLEFIPVPESPEGLTP